MYYSMVVNYLVWYNYLGPQNSNLHLLTNMEFTPNAREALVVATQIALENKHAWVGVDHLLLAILSEPKCGAVKSLEILGVPINNLKDEILHQFKDTTENLTLPLRYSFELIRLTTYALSIAEALNSPVDTKLMVGLMSKLLMIDLPSFRVSSEDLIPEDLLALPA